MKHKILKLKQDELPEKLKKIEKAPKQLYLIGNKELLFENCFGIVGTRRITDYGKNNCEFFTRELVFRNIPIVSGMAVGTDSVAHKTCLEYGGKTIAVLGSGFDNIFPEENIELFEKIIENDGLVITEYENNVKPLKENFPQRNRIVTALSEGILVVEAGFRSGTSITVTNAKKQGKKVFAIPGKLDSCVGVGVNNMIKQGAILTTNIQDIISNFPQFEHRLRKNTNRKHSKSEKINDDYKEIYDILENRQMSIEELLQESNLSFKEIIKLLTKMEIEGIVEQDLLGNYKIN